MFQMCKIDDHISGMLPSYSYNLMLVYFLQQSSPPLLPVISESNTGTPHQTTIAASVASVNFCSIEYAYLIIA